MPADREFWFSPKNLASDEQRMRAAPLSAAMSGDFGSYAIANRSGLQGSRIEGHNLIHADARVRLYGAILPKRRPRHIADIGCGLGLTTMALKRRFSEAKVVGYEISRDAIEYAQRVSNGVEFREMTIDPSSSLGGVFDLILCQEFYAFTRTNDWDWQEGYVEMLVRHMAPKGILLIELSQRDWQRTILANAPRLSNLATARGLTLWRRELPFDRIFRTAPWVTIANGASAILATVLGRPRNVIIGLTAGESDTPT